MKGKLVKRKDRWDLYDSDGQKIGSSLEGAGGRLSVINCEAISRGIDLEKIREGFIEELLKGVDEPDQWRGFAESDADRFMEGVVMMLELLSDKRYSKSDMLVAYNQGTNDGVQFESMRDYDSDDDNETFEFAEESEKEFINSLQKTEFDVEIKMECKIGCGNLILNGKNSVCCGNKVPKLGPDGCLILKIS